MRRVKTVKRSQLAEYSKRITLADTRRDNIGGIYFAYLREHKVKDEEEVLQVQNVMRLLGYNVRRHGDKIKDDDGRAMYISDIVNGHFFNNGEETV